MSSIKPPVYKADDRSILLPYYRRFCVDPFLPFIPSKMKPNTITHLGHLVMALGAALILALRPTTGWVYGVTLVLLWLYVFADNADGAHARRTNQASPLGEFLDHGLDLLNCVYIGVVSAWAIDADGLTWMMMGFMVPLAAAACYWEQANTGIFRVGLVSQIESSVFLSCALVVDVFTSNAFFSEPRVLGFSVRDGIMLWTFTGVIVGVVRGIWNVGFKDLRKQLPILSLIALNGALFLAWRVGKLEILPLMLVGNFSNVAFGLRMLSFRLRREEPRVDLLFCAVAVALVFATVFGRDAAGWVLGLAIVACVLFTVEGALAARATVRRLNSIDTA